MSTITLYKHCKIEEERNFIVDSISTYLTTLISEDFTNYQYIKQGLDTEIKVALSQDNIGLNNTLDFNYCKVSNDVYGNDYYYFVRNILWTSKNAIKLVLRLDTLNTFNGKYSLDKQTKILRQHEDRFKRDEAYTITNYIERENFGIPLIPGQYPYVFEYQEDIDTYMDRTTTAEIKIVGSPLMIQPQIKTVNVVLNKVIVHLEWALNPNLWKGVELKLNYSASTNIVRKINKIPEGINPTLFNKKKLESILYNNKENKNEDWYLVYYGASADAIGTYLTNKNGFIAKLSNQNTKTIQVADLTVGEYYFIDFSKVGTPSPYGNGSNAHSPIVVKCYKNNEIVQEVVVGADGTSYSTTGSYPAHTITFNITASNTIRVIRNNYYTNGANKNVWYWWFTETIGEDFDKIEIEASETYRVYNSVNSQVLRSVWLASEYEDVTISSNEQQVLGIDSLNRKDVKLSKIIKIPYLPIEGLFVNDVYDLSNTAIGYDADLHMLSIPDSTVFNSYIGMTYENEIKDAFDIVDEIINIYPTTYDLRNDANESKIYNSEFYSPKYVYDTFAKQIAIESITNQDSRNKQFTFKVSRDTTSGMLIKFDAYTSNYSTEDFNEYLYINRNNQLPIYTSAYQSYMQTGYNYDVKNQQISFIKSGLQIPETTLIGGLGGFKTGGIGGAVSGAVGGAYHSISSLIFSQIDQQNAIDQKIFLSQQQAVSVRDCNNVDLMSEYAKNKLIYKVYELSDEQKKNVLDLFYYNGYKSGKMEKPNTNSRTWFNFVQCIPVFEKKSTSAFLNIDIKNDIIERYNNGVTFMHNVNGEYDFDQVKENYETWLFN